MEFLTREEYERIENRLKMLKARRPELSVRIAEARALGDLKENADYHAAREDQAMDEAEIRTLEARLSSAKVVDDAAVPDGVVFIGAMVKMREVHTGDEDLYRLVGEATGDLTLEYIEVTVSSPMGEAMMKSRIGEVIKVSAPRGEIRFEIVEIL